LRTFGGEELVEAVGAGAACASEAGAVREAARESGAARRSGGKGGARLARRRGEIGNERKCLPAAGKGGAGAAGSLAGRQSRGEARERS